MKNKFTPYSVCKIIIKIRIENFDGNRDLWLLVLHCIHMCEYKGLLSTVKNKLNEVI